MELIWDSLRQALHMIFTADPTVLDAGFHSLWISGVAVTGAGVVGLPLGALLARVRFPARRIIITLFRAGMAVPTVFIGLVCFAFFERHGPLGPYDLLFTPGAIMVGEFMLALPLVVTISHGAIEALDPRVAETAKSLGAGLVRRWLTYLSEAKAGILVAMMTAFARCVTELGIAMMVGGNIKERTQTLATATALETGQGEFARGLAMGLILLLIAMIVTSLIVFLAREDE